ncbi:MAG: hypothetical protein ACT4P2_02845 [Pseudomonadota bacterium]
MSRAMMCLAVAAGLVAALPADAQRSCAKRADLLKHLADRYQEVPVAIGLADNGGVLEVLTSADGTTFTVTITMPNGIACMLATGQHWENVPRVVASGPPA